MSAGQVLAALRQRGLTLASAESLTGGLLGADLTAVAGSSDVFRGGVVCYATDLKATLVGVDEDLLAAYGPVSPQTVEALAAGIRQTCGADVGVATTGVAGPSEQDGHPVGEVYVAVAGPDADAPVVRRLHLAGSRDEIRRQTVTAALELVLSSVRPG